MKILAKFVTFVLPSILLCLVFFPKNVLAADQSNSDSANEFMTSYDVSYDISASGATAVTEKISLRNLTSQYYVSNFTLTIGATNISDVSAADGSGPMEVKTAQSDGKTSITASFNQQVAGLGKTQVFTLKFSSTDFAEKIGKTWEVNLPKIPQSDNIDAYNLTLSVPVAFGDPTSISPQPKSQTQSFDKIFLTFTKEQLINNGVSVTYGDTQVYNFNIKYPLKNDSFFAVITSVTIPPDTPFQDVYIDQITPQPLNVTIDSDGNYLAWFRVERRSNLDASVTGSIKLYISDKAKVAENSLLTQNPTSLSTQDTAELTKADTYWEKDNPLIKSTLQGILAGQTNLTTKEKARLIYRYIVNHLKYNIARANDQNIERLGAVTALNNPENAVCMEFTDLFIALARAAGIPARELDGYAYSSNTTLRPLSLEKDLLHAWPEYFDPGSGWVMVDPTWENTSGGVDYFNKFDLSHVTLAIKGYSSLTPTISDNVKVDLSNDNFSPQPHTIVGTDIPQSILAGYPTNASVKLSNNGHTLQAGTNMFIYSSDLVVLGQKEITFGPIPPYGSTTYNFKLKTPTFWQNNTQKVEIDIADQKINKEVVVKPFFLFQPFPEVFAGLIGLMITIYVVVLLRHILNVRANKKSTNSM
ncbi:transglutaminase-like domain-containing protein [Patescibacteria group bacterium]|nr:transglutaminase-like domain-containing protein [Patescibacteria group bacterium]MCL5409608.1 transglutaminase-like domain-containing protein [Patescibacteria group bacterium]